MVPAESLTAAFDTLQENLESQIVILKRVNEISESQLDMANQIIEEMKGKSLLQDQLIESLSAMNDRYEAVLKERDDFIKSLRI